MLFFFPGRRGEGIVTAMCDTGLPQCTSAGCKLLVRSGAGSAGAANPDSVLVLIPGDFWGVMSQLQTKLNTKERCILELL